MGQCDRWHADAAAAPDGRQGAWCSATPSCCVRPLFLTPDGAKLIVGGAGAFRRHHKGAERRLRRAGPAEHFALPRLDDALQDLAALAGFGIGDTDRRHAEFALRIEARIGRTQPDARMVNRAKPTPFEKFPQLVYTVYGGERFPVGVLGNDTVVLIFDLAAAFGDLL